LNRTSLLLISGRVWTASDKALKTVFLGLAYGTHLRWPISGTKVTAHPASPNRQRQVSQPTGNRLWLHLIPLVRRQTPLRYGTSSLPSVHDGL